MSASLSSTLPVPRTGTLKAVTALNVQPLASSSRTAQVVEQLTSLVLNGKWKPAEPLPPERELARQLGVSRNVVREATKILQSRGLLSIRQGVGTIVNASRSEPLQHAFTHALHGQEDAIVKLTEVRLLIEVEMAALAAHRATEKDLQQIRAILKAMESSLEDRERWIELDMAFHNAVAAATQNNVFALVLAASAALTQEVRKLALEAGTTTRESLQQHRRIFEAIEKRDTKQAANRMRAHLKYAVADIEHRTT